MESTVLSPLLPPPPIPPMIPLDHSVLLSQMKTTARNSILICNDNGSMTTNTYMADSGFDSSTSQVGPQIPSSMNSTSACTAFMIQTQTGNALLIPHSQGIVLFSSILYFKLDLIVLSVCIR